MSMSKHDKVIGALEGHQFSNIQNIERRNISEALQILRDAFDGIDVEQLGSVVMRLTDPDLPQGVKDHVLETNGALLLTAAAKLHDYLKGE